MAASSATVLFHLLSLGQLSSGKVGTLVPTTLCAILYCSCSSGLAHQFGLTSSDKLDGELVGSKFDSLGLTDKVQLVKNVAQGVQVTTCSRGGGAQYLLVHRITAVMQLIFLRSFISKL